MPVIGTGIMAIGIVLVWLALQAYIIDAFGIYAASAIAANAFIRSAMGAFIPLAGPPLYNAIGLGWGNSRKSLFLFLSLLTFSSWIHCNGHDAHSLAILQIRRTTP